MPAATLTRFPAILFEQGGDQKGRRPGEIDHGERCPTCCRRPDRSRWNVPRLAPTWVPRSFLQPGRRLKLHPDDYYALGMHRGGIDERWFGSTTEAANENRNADEGLSRTVVHGDERFLLRDAVAELRREVIGDHIWKTYKKWPVYSKFFDNMGPIPHHMHQNAEQAALVGQEGKPESYYFPPQMNHDRQQLPVHLHGAGAGHHQSRMSSHASTAGTRATTASSTCRRRTD